MGKRLKPVDVMLSGMETEDQDSLIRECLLHHFYRQGQFEVAQTLLEESHMEQDAGLREPYIQLANLRETLLHNGDTGPCLQWAEDHASQLGDDGQRLRFQLVRLKYVQLLQTSPNAALVFAQKAFPSFSNAEYNHDIQTLMGCLAFANRLATSPYADYLSQDFLGMASTALSSAYCKMQALPQENAFTQCIRLGITALPKIHRVMSLMKERRGIEWSQQGELPVEIELPSEMRYHSVFVCPVLRQQSTQENPPMMLPCGHAICQEALGRLSKGNQFARFKCPYCPAECCANQTMQVYF